MAASPNPAPQGLSGTVAPTGIIPDTWLDRQDLLQLFHVSVRTLQKWRSNGILPYSKIGNKIYYRRSDVEAMLQKARKTG